ncbi:MAG: putative Mg2+ and Co2+ transporter CorC [Anaerosolibacter sp.]|jgi:hypothetical protein|uniref:hypothetical protein n=1 Tax=Anaerosolibacter sp. TaxID=1872527 RepID=UPI00260AC8EA|nr:hypothetical protein [Anaerosolibacter sp.]MDF2548895.1 putative Mg2+ and Co2+ transporter CorC [Anaerosolibacter sp.]
MSAYSFIATDYEIPEIDNSKEKIITVQEAIELEIKAHELMPWEKMNPNDKILFFEKESDLGELVIRKDNVYDKNVRWYTDKPFIYSVDFKYTELRAKQLLEYLKENIGKGQQLELWSIWLDDRKNIQPTICNYEEVSIHNLKQMYDWKGKKHVSHSCIIIER